MALRGPPTAHLKPKMFVRRQDKNNHDFYTYNNRPFLPKQPGYGQLFVIKDLLLDLDDERCRHVRAFVEEDEPGMEKRWQTSPSTRTIQNWSEAVEKQLYLSRQKAFEISKGPASQWMPTTRDILSAAFHGTPASNAPTTQNQDKGVPLGSSSDGSSRDPGRINTICLENGFPKQAVVSDHVLLDTLKRRQLVLKPSREIQETGLSSTSLVNSLAQQTSINGLRRVVFHAISSGLGVENFQDTLSASVRAVCLKVVENAETNDGTRLQALAFLGNLQTRLSLSGSHIGAPLCGVGLRLSAEVASPAATLEYLTIGFTHSLWANGSALLEDLRLSLKTYEGCLIRASGEGLTDLDRGSLLHTLTGAEWAGRTNEDSVRAVLMLNQNGDSDNEQSLHETFAALLEKLGPR